jgi:hypothetical protein
MVAKSDPADKSERQKIREAGSSKQKEPRQ